MNSNKVVLGLSGGVDSSLAAALLLEKGYELHPMFLSYRGADSLSAERACRELGLELEVADITDSLEKNVICPFIEGYLKGVTPSPCVMCNPSVKFRFLYEEAKRLDAMIATGHYAVQKNGRIYASPSPKDQSYMLCRLPREVIERCVFPLGEFENKEEVRREAMKRGLSSHKTGDSMDVCFIPEGDHAAFIESRGLRGKAGSFVDEKGNLLAPHKGIHNYTVGQRRGLGVAAEGRLYVKKIDAERGDVTLSLTDPACDGAYIKDIYFAAPEYEGKGEFPVNVKLRYTKGFLKGRFISSKGLIVLDKQARAASPGQVAVCYDGDGMVICCGTITDSYHKEDGTDECHP